MFATLSSWPSMYQNQNHHPNHSYHQRPRQSSTLSPITNNARPFLLPSSPLSSPVSFSLSMNSSSAEDQQQASKPDPTSTTSSLQPPPPPAPAAKSRHAFPRSPQHQLAGIMKSPRKRRELRNAVLLKGVRDRRQSARDGLRSELILRSDMLAEQRAWEGALEREAARWTVGLDLGEEEDMQMVDGMDGGNGAADAELEDLIRRDEEELLLAQAQAAQEEMQAQRHDRSHGMAVVGEGYGSDQDDFDMLFLEAVEEFERTQDSNDRGMDLS